MSSTILRQAKGTARVASRQCAFSTSTVARRDLIKELYLNKLKAYKPPPAAKDAHVGVVKTFSVPPPPPVPTLPADLASELAAYDAQEPTVAGAAVVEGVPSGKNAADSFLEVIEADIPQAEAHH